MTASGVRGTAVRVLVRVLATMLLAWAALSCLAFAAAFWALPPLLLGFGIIALLYSLLVIIAIWKLWRHPRISPLVWCVLLPAFVLSLYVVGRAGYARLIYRDFSVPVQDAVRDIEVLRKGLVSGNDAVLSLSGLLDAGFERVDIAGVRYRKVGDADYIVRRAPADDAARYLVQETILTPRGDGGVLWPSRGDMRITVTDRHSGIQIGLWNGPGPGWPEMQAAQFVLDLLRPGQRLPGKPYRSLHMVEVIAREPGLARRNGTLVDCPADFIVAPSQQGLFTELRTPAWIFGKYGLGYEAVICHGADIFLFSRMGVGYQVDRLSAAGQVTGHASYRTAYQDKPGSSMERIMGLARRDGRLLVHYATFPTGSGDDGAAASAAYDVVLPGMSPPS